ncbi:hypothetical protein Tco_0167463 [Tanacetum coccineum]
MLARCLCFREEVRHILIMIMKYCFTEHSALNYLFNKKRRQARIASLGVYFFRFAFKLWSKFGVSLVIAVHPSSFSDSLPSSNDCGQVEGLKSTVSKEFWRERSEKTVPHGFSQSISLKISRVPDDLSRSYSASHPCVMNLVWGDLIL